MWLCNSCGLWNYATKSNCIACFHSKSDKAQLKQTNYKYEIIIIGGGVAGTTTAIELSKRGIKCCLLEATNRLGGRAYSEKWTNDPNPCYLDLGCQWLTYANKRKHILIDLAKQEYDINVFGDILTKTDIKNSRTLEQLQKTKEWIIYDVMTDKCYPSQLYSIISDPIIDYLDDNILDEEYLEKVQKKYRKSTEKPSRNDCSIYDIFIDTYNKRMVENIERRHKKLMKKLKRKFDMSFMQRCIDWSLAWFEGYESLLVEESYYHWFDDEEIHYDDIDMQGKYGLLMETMITKGIDTKHVNIHLKTVCKSIKYNASSNKMEIIASNASNNEIKYECNNCVVAVSVGCLQKRIIKIPDLKQDVWNVIDNGWGMYHSNKILIQFEDHFKINNHIKRLTILTPQEKYTADDENKSIHIPGMHQKYSLCLRHVNKDYNIWNMLLMPRYSYTLTEMDDDEMDNILLNDILNIFGKVFGVLPKVERFKVTHWDTNPFFCGTWPYFKKNGGGINSCEIIQNMENNNLFDSEIVGYRHNILFAGDFTENGNGVCQNAFNSGKRVAEQIIN